MISNTETYRLGTKYAEEVLVPAGAIDERWFNRVPNTDARFKTTDGVLVKLNIIAVTRNRNGWRNDVFDKYCRERYGMGFDLYRAIWCERNAVIDDFWYRIALEKCQN